MRLEKKSHIESYKADLGISCTDLSHVLEEWKSCFADIYTELVKEMSNVEARGQKKSQV